MTSRSRLRPQAAEWLRTVIPADRRRRLAWTRLSLRVPTAHLREFPDVLIVGAQRAGTSSVYRYLGGHPDVAPSLRKETEYFSYYYDRGEYWYRAHFPLTMRRLAHRLVRRRSFVSFEATPDYLVDPRAARRAARLVPHAKIIVLLRDPVTRAFSHYRHMTRLGYETLPFEAAIAEEELRIGEARDRLTTDESFVSKAFLRFSYLERGQYARQLRTWFECFERDRVLAIRSEDLYAEPSRSFDTILRFVGLPRWRPAAFANYSYNARIGQPEQPPIAASTRSDLEAHFAAPNLDLYALLGRDMGWGQLRDRTE